MSKQFKRFILINVVDPHLHTDEALEDLEELRSLVSTFGGATIVKIIQHKTHPDPHTFVGSGKAKELVELVQKEKIDVIVIDEIAKPTQLFNLTKMIWPVNDTIEVWDRIDLILHIFEKHARTAEAKLQIDLARMRNMGPRIYGLGGTLLSRQGGGTGAIGGQGETNTEIMKRHFRDQTKKIESLLKKLEDDRTRKLERRREIGLHTVSIVGYTNAGKTTLFNTLTGKKKLAENILFATLDSNIGHMYSMKLRKEILISDTIGFIKNLPPSLVQAFKSTLLESIHSHILLHVIDASDPKMHDKIFVVESIIHDLGIELKEKIYVFNKVDVAKNINKTELMSHYGDFKPQFISSKTGEGIENLKKTIEGLFENIYLL